MTESPFAAGPADGSAAGPGGQAAAYPGPPHWVKLAAIVAVLVVVLVLVVMIVSGGEHGPLRHTPSAAGTIVSGSAVSRL